MSKQNKYPWEMTPGELRQEIQRINDQLRRGVATDKDLLVRDVYQVTLDRLRQEQRRLQRPENLEPDACEVD